MYPDRFSGTGPTISTCYLMALVFDRLDWHCCGFGNYLLDRLDVLNVITSKGIFYEKGILTDNLSAEGTKALQTAEYIQYYRQR